MCTLPATLQISPSIVCFILHALSQPPKLAFQREQFFANLLKKANRGKGGRTRTIRRPYRGRIEQREQKMDAAAESPGLNAAPVQSGRIIGGFAGTKLMRGAGLERPGTSGSGPRYPTRRLLTPDDGVSEVHSRRAHSQPAGRAAYARPRTSTIIMTPGEEFPQAEPETNSNHEQWLEMRSLTEVHHHDLTMMKNEIQDLRDELGAALERGADMSQGADTPQ